MSIPVLYKESLFKAEKPGFLLAEILVALLIFVGLGTVVIHYQWHSAQLYYKTQQEAEAFAQTINVIEKYSILGTLPVQEQQTGNIKISWFYEPIKVAMRAPFLVEQKDQTCLLLHVQARWRMAENERVLTFVTGESCV